MTIAELAPSLRPLVLLLSSDKPGEVAAAAAQITRRLARAGLDWHQLADALKGRPENLTELRRPGGHAATCWSGVAEFLASQADELSPRDREFVRSMGDLIARGWTPTTRQATWLFARASGCWATEEAA